MKKLCVLAMASLLTFSSCALLNTEEAPAPILPETALGVSVCLGFDATNHTAIMDNGKIEQVISIIETATPTKRQSVNDTPYADEVYCVRFIGEEEYIPTYLYQDERLFGLISHWYLEQPYHGIYEITKESAEILLNL